ncbi:hypothetical protein [Sphingomonas alba]|uniref:Energy transducer TonB n=1 Tax=Sphingomonas alba TaxID=2908208 RepID=A0ABT0RL31_9SPHN|nr:hypothetical protein [Sphingomonas alba]MCL6683278.1 hypothetical protein [Sphingomonas alba]
MHSIRQSRGRIAFEVLCTLTVAASCVAAWMQTYATAFLPAAVATGLYGLWHLTDMRSPKPVADAPALPDESDLPVVHFIPAEPEPVVAFEPAKPEEAPKAKKPSRKKKATVQEVTVVTEVAQPEASEAIGPETVEPETVEPQAVEPDMLEPEVPTDFPDRTAIEEELHAPIAPLFETKPVPFQQRPTFGKRGRLGL